ncbi:MAG TPA: hypothetical protein VGP94_06630, partial [Tepidisphaeraceae bacterium]|nr:hypothetical protein [Tepidisphaeraceae bacterium]
MLGEDLERAIRHAWLGVRKQILSDPLELRRRLARRRLKTLTRPPRAWCIAIRASDRRITPAHWIITPEHAMDLDHPEHAYEPIEHEVTIQKHGIRYCCNPVSFSREDAVDVAKMLGVSPSQVLRGRWRGQFEECFYKGLGGKRGRPVPLLSPKGELLDPGHQEFARPNPIWGSMWEFLSRLFPDDFEQTVVRRPVFRRMDGVRLPAPMVDSDALTPALYRHGDSTTRREREQVFEYKDEMRFMGWWWVCPGCKKSCRTIYYPLPVRTLFDSWFTDPVIQLRLSDADLAATPAACFACCRCHGVNWDSSIHPGFWNEVIGYLSGGMLYGREVEKPAGFVGRRKRTRVRQLDRSAPKMREVMERFSKGWSDFEIAMELG